MKCLLCGAIDITITTENRFVFVACHACGAELQIEFDPPDAPELRGRIVEVERWIDDDDVLDCR